MPETPETQKERSSQANSRIVAAAILLSRVFGLVREAVLSQFFGLSLYADAFRAALRMPNLLQNLLGEGTLSASFIPVYAELVGQGKKEDEAVSREPSSRCCSPSLARSPSSG